MLAAEDFEIALGIMRQFYHIGVFPVKESTMVLLNK